MAPCSSVQARRNVFSFVSARPVMAAALGVIQDGRRFAVPLRERVRDPADVVKVAVNVQRPLRSKDITDDDRFVGTRCR